MEIRRDDDRVAVPGTLIFPDSSGAPYSLLQ